MKRIPPTKAIRLMCLDCSVDQPSSVKACSVLNCPLWKWRLGKNPFTEKNKENPFLEPNNFIGMEDKPTYEVIELLEKKEAQNQ